MKDSGKQIVCRSGDRRRLRRALSHEFTGDVPFLEIYVAQEIVEQVLGRPVGTHMLKLKPDDYVEFLQRTGMDAAYLYEGWFLGRRNKLDDHGRPQYIDGTIKSSADFCQIKPPSLDLARRRVDSFLQAAEHTNLGAMYALDVSVTLANTAIGPTDFLLAMYDRPDFVNEFLDRVEEYTLPLAECIKQYPLDAIWLSGLLCCNAGPMLSPEMHQKFIFPRLEKVLKIIKPSNIPVILHSDGDNSAFLDWIIQSGFSALHPIEPGIGRFDIYKLKQTCGDRLCLCGNIDVGTVLSRGTPEEVQSDVLEHIYRLAPGGGYICGSSHDVGENISFASFINLTYYR